MIQKNMNKKMKGFTLVELLAVIAVLGLILIIAVPKVMDVLNAQKKRTFELTAKSIIKSAEEKYLENNAYGIEEEITCESIANISKNEYQVCEISFDEEGNASVSLKGKGNYEGLNVCYGTKISAVATTEKCPVSFASDDWKTIVKAVKSGNYPYKVGDTKTIDKGDLAGHIIRVANTTPCEGLELASQTACGFVLEFADVISFGKMNITNTNVGSWPASVMRTYLNDEEDDTSVYSLLPKDLKDGIIETTVVSGHGSGDETGTLENYNFKSTDKLYLLSTREVWGANPGNDSAATSGITRQLDYYSVNDVTLLTYEGAIKNNGENTSRWWLRSASSWIHTCFYLVTTNGYWEQGSASPVYGVSPAFRLAE